MLNRGCYLNTSSVTGPRTGGAIHWSIPGIEGDRTVASWSGGGALAVFPGRRCVSHAEVWGRQPAQEVSGVSIIPGPDSEKQFYFIASVLSRDTVSQHSHGTDVSDHTIQGRCRTFPVLSLMAAGCYPENTAGALPASAGKTAAETSLRWNLCKRGFMPAVQ